MTANVTIRIQQADFDIGREIAALTAGRTDIGAVVTFSGICRSSEGDEAITALTLEHYPGMAEAEIARHAETAMSRWPLTGLTVIHRFGRITPGENIVLVLTASAHRQAAFQAAEFLMDYLKAKRRSGSARKSPPEPTGSTPTATTTRPPRAGPNPDGEARKTGGEAARHGKTAQGRIRRTQTLLDFVRYATSRFIEPAGVRAWHHRSGGGGRLPGLRNASPASRPVRGVRTARVTAHEGKAILDVIARRVATRKPAAYIVNKIYMRGLPFYVDERTIVPRSFIGELLDSISAARMTKPAAR